MPKPGEHKSVQARILQYAQEIGWTFVPRHEAEARRGFSETEATTGLQAAEPNALYQARAQAGSLYFTKLLFDKVQQFNPRYTHKPSDLFNRLRMLKADIYGNRDFLDYLRAQQTYWYAPEQRELNLQLINYEQPAQNVYEVTEEYYYHNGQYGTREDVVFLINGIPVLVIECKNATLNEGIALGIEQVRRYHRETPEAFVPQQLFTATDSLGFHYGVTWNMIRRNIFNWKSDHIGQLEMKLKSFCSIPGLLAYLKDYIIFAEKDEVLNKYILRQHQKTAVEKVVQRCTSTQRSRGLVWHTQGSGKTFTMIKAAEMLFKAPDGDKPTILLLLDRNELEDQMKKNLVALGITHTESAYNMGRLRELLANDYRGIIVCMMHKFRNLPANANTRSNIYVLIDEAHRTTGGDLGTFLMAGLPNASYIGFTGTPIDKTHYGKGTFKTFGLDDEKGYLHKYSISESIADGTTLPLYYQLAPNELLVPRDILEEEFLQLAEEYGMADIEELNKVLERAVNTKNFLKGEKRVQKVAQYVAQHYTQTVEPLGYKAFLVGVDRPACVKLKQALDRHLPPEYSAVVYTGNNNDSKALKAFHLQPKQEKNLRRDFTKHGELPKILIVTEKLLTGYDAPLLYAMYLDKPMKDHTLLQAIARVNRPYENEARAMVKPHGFVLDFVGIFEKLEQALAFDSDEVNAIVKDIKLLKHLFKSKMETKVPPYLALIEEGFIDKDTDRLIAHFRDKDLRKEFFKEYKEIEMLYEIISPDAFLRPYIEPYGTLASIYQIVRKAYARRVYVDREFQQKTSELVQSHIGSTDIPLQTEFVTIDADTIERIKANDDEGPTRVINLVMSIERIAEEESEDPFLISLSERAAQVQERYENRQLSTQQAIAELLGNIEAEEKRKKEQAERGLDGLSFFVFRTLLDQGMSENDSEKATQRIKEAFAHYPNWHRSENDLRDLRSKVLFAIARHVDDMQQASEWTAQLINLLLKARPNT